MLAELPACNGLTRKEAQRLTTPAARWTAQPRIERDAHRAEAEADAAPCAKAPRQIWAELLRRTFAVDVLRCPRSGGRRHRVATLTDPLVARRILHHSIDSIDHSLVFAFTGASGKRNPDQSDFLAVVALLLQDFEGHLKKSIEDLECFGA